MDTIDILHSYDAEVRAKPMARTGLTIQDDGDVVRLKGPFEFVSWWRLTDLTMDAAVARVVAEARGTGAPLIWRVFEHDGPAGLSACLERHGFISKPKGTLMVFDLQGTLPSSKVCAELRRAATPGDVEDHLAVMDAVFEDDDGPRLKRAYDALLDDPHFGLFTAYLAGRPIAGGRLESGPGQKFGALFGGSVRPEHRGQGIYRALVDARAQEARRLGLHYLSTEALETSRPILERLGFNPVAREITWVLAE